MIREAREADIPALIEMGARFAEACGVKDRMGYDPASAEKMFQMLMSSDDGVLLVLDIDGPRGATGGLLHPCLFNNAHRTGQELFWWVDPDWRGNGLSLFVALEETVRAKGAQSWMMGSIGLEDDRLERIYTRSGYAPADKNYIKVF